MACLTSGGSGRKIRPLREEEWRTPVIDTRPIRFNNSIARRAWLRLVSTQPKAFIAPRFLNQVEKDRASKVVVPKKP